MARPEIPPKTGLALRLRDIRRQLGDPERGVFAEGIGISKSTIASYERGERTPDAAMLKSYQDTHGVDLNWLISGKGNMFRPKEPAGLESIFVDHAASARDAAFGPAISNALRRAQDTPAQLADHMITLPMFSGLSASAGKGLVPTGDHTSSAIAFDPQFLRDLGATPSQCTVISAQGGSMSPTIPDGGMLVVDHSQQAVVHGCIYVFSVADRLLVKRARWSMDSTLTLISDNPSPDYPDESFKLEDAHELKVVGRVVFHGNRA